MNPSLYEWNRVCPLIYLFMFGVESKVPLSYLPPLAISFLHLLSCSSMNELVDKFNTAYEKHSRRGGRTAFFWDVQLSKPTLHVWDWFISSSSPPFWVHECIAIGNLGNCIALDLITRQDKMWSCLINRAAYVFFSACTLLLFLLVDFSFFLISFSRAKYDLEWEFAWTLPQGLLFCFQYTISKIQIGNDNFLC